jgi:aminocarboxymuconate-semialdehyde decarboxylase
MFYADTALFGAPHALECAVKFFGADRVLFASDMPFDPENGALYIPSTISDVDALQIDESERQKIYEGNAQRVLGVRLP